MTKGFLGYGDKDAYAVYGAYTALVYMTPFFGGLLADRLLGQRRAVAFGGLLMALGHLLMGVDWNFSVTVGGQSIVLVERRAAFFTALPCLICGNGFFKPNISTIVGSLYGHGNPRRNGGFTIFYMGVNLGAAIAPLLCGYIGETYSWHWGFGLATVGMLVGNRAIFVAPAGLRRFSFFSTTFSAAGAMLVLSPRQFSFRGHEYLSSPRHFSHFGDGGDLWRWPAAEFPAKPAPRPTRSTLRNPYWVPSTGGLDGLSGHRRGDRRLLASGLGIRAAGLKSGRPISLISEDTAQEAWSRVPAPPFGR